MVVRDKTVASFVQSHSRRKCVAESVTAPTTVEPAPMMLRADFGNTDQFEDDVRDEIEEEEEEEEEEALEEEEAVADEVPPEGVRPAKHVRPCVCDLTAEQRRRIREHHQRTTRLQQRFERRVREIEKELERMEEERLERERELREQQELFGDEYEMVGQKKKRVKRSARRASMVSLGVKQLINWRREPKIKVKYNQAFKMRCENQSYCDHKVFPLAPIKEIAYSKIPNIPVRVTKAYTLRSEINGRKHESLAAGEDKLPLFLSAFWR